MKNTSENISSKMANDLIEMEKSSVSRIVGLETAVSKYHVQILETIIASGIFNQSYKISPILWIQSKQMCPQILLF